MNIFERYVKNINNMQAPGMAPNQLVIFVRDDAVYAAGMDGHEHFNVSDNVSGLISQKLIPWAFVNGIYLSENTHGNFVMDRYYEDAETIANKSEDDYSVDAQVLNFVFATMSAANNWHNHKENSIVVILFAAEEGRCVVRKFKDEKEFAEAVEEELEYLEAE